MAHRLGLTGGIGSGKSTVAALLAKQGAHVIDADAISRAATGPGGSAIAAIRAQFGPAMVNAQGALDRDQMRALVFTNPEARRQLERIVHPLVGLAIAAQTQVAEQSGARCIVLDIPLLVESAHWRASLERVLVVDCTEATQVARVTARSGLGDTEVLAIMANQAPRAQRLACADGVVFNDGINLDQLAELVREIGHQFGL
jgi:dephospho-CoA kinase